MFKTLTKEFSVSPTNSSLVGILITIGDVTGGEEMGVLPYMSYISMCGPKGYGFLSAVVVMNTLAILADFSHFGHRWGMGMIFKKKPLSQQNVY